MITRAMLVLVGTCWLWNGGQDPQPAAGDRPPPAPADAAALPPVQEPYVEPVLRTDLPERFSPRDPIEGFWRMHDRQVGGLATNPGAGYMAVGRRHLVVHFQAPGPNPDIDLLRVGTYTWERVDEQGGVRMVTQIGHFNDGNGDVMIEPAGNTEVRRFELRDGFLRVYQDAGNWIEFARVE